MVNYILFPLCDVYLDIRETSVIRSEKFSLKIIYNGTTSLYSPKCSLRTNIEVDFVGRYVDIEEESFPLCDFSSGTYQPPKVSTNNIYSYIQFFQLKRKANLYTHLYDFKETFYLLQDKKITYEAALIIDRPTMFSIDRKNFYIFSPNWIAYPSSDLNKVIKGFRTNKNLDMFEYINPSYMADFKLNNAVQITYTAYPTSVNNKYYFQYNFDSAILLNKIYFQKVLPKNGEDVKAGTYNTSVFYSKLAHGNFYLTEELTVSINVLINDSSYIVDVPSDIWTGRLKRKTNFVEALYQNMELVNVGSNSSNFDYSKMKLIDTKPLYALLFSFKHQTNSFVNVEEDIYYLNSMNLPFNTPIVLSKEMDFHLNVSKERVKVEEEVYDFGSYSYSIERYLITVETNLYSLLRLKIYQQQEEMVGVYRSIYFNKHIEPVPSETPFYKPTILRLSPAQYNIFDLSLMNTDGYKIEDYRFMNIVESQYYKPVYTPTTFSIALLDNLYSVFDSKVKVKFYFSTGSIKGDVEVGENIYPISEVKEKSELFFTRDYKNYSNVLYTQDKGIFEWSEETLNKAKTFMNEHSDTILYFTSKSIYPYGVMNVISLNSKDFTKEYLSINDNNYGTYDGYPYFNITSSVSVVSQKERASNYKIYNLFGTKLMFPEFRSDMYHIQDNTETNIFKSNIKLYKLENRYLKTWYQIDPRVRKPSSMFISKRSIGKFSDTLYMVSDTSYLWKMSGPLEIDLSQENTFLVNIHKHKYTNKELNIKNYFYSIKREQRNSINALYSHKDILSYMNSYFDTKPFYNRVCSIKTFETNILTFTSEMNVVIDFNVTELQLGMEYVVEHYDTNECLYTLCDTSILYPRDIEEFKNTLNKMTIRKPNDKMKVVYSPKDHLTIGANKINVKGLRTKYNVFWLQIYSYNYSEKGVIDTPLWDFLFTQQGWDIGLHIEYKYVDEKVVGGETRNKPSKSSPPMLIAVPIKLELPLKSYSKISKISYVCKEAGTYGIDTYKELENKGFQYPINSDDKVIIGNYVWGVKKDIFAGNLDIKSSMFVGDRYASDLDIFKSQLIDSIESEIDLNIAKEYDASTISLTKEDFDKNINEQNLSAVNKALSSAVTNVDKEIINENVSVEDIIKKDPEKAEAIKEAVDNLNDISDAYVWKNNEGRPVIDGKLFKKMKIKQEINIQEIKEDEDV